MTDHPDISPLPGYVLARPYLLDTTMFSLRRESGGEDVVSEVLAMGPDVTDTHGIERYPHCKAGDIIVSADSNKTIEVQTHKLRFVHFSEIHGILTLEKKAETS